MYVLYYDDFLGFMELINIGATCPVLNIKIYIEYHKYSTLYNI